MDLLNSLVNSDGHSCNQVDSQTFNEMSFPYALKVKKTVTDVESIDNTQALAVGLASSQQHNNTLTPPEESSDADQSGRPPSAQLSQKENEPPFHDHGLNLQSIEDFDKEHPYTPKTKQSTSPSLKSNSGAVSQFHYLCHMHNLRCEFHISEAQGGGFLAKVTAGPIIEEIDFACPAKQAAKEAVCQLAIPKLEALPIPQKTREKRKAASPVQEPTVRVDNSENWISILNEYTQKEKKSPPSYDAMPTPTGEWTCTCNLALTGGVPQGFGSKEVGYRVKQDAKIMAAKDAVVWLRQQGKLLPAGVKRQKIDPNTLPAGQTGLTQAINKFAIEPAESIPQRMNRLVQSLGLNTPTYNIRPSSFSTGQGGLANGYWDVDIVFDARDIVAMPMLAGRIGEARHVYGKAKAKEVCSQKAVQILEEFEASRDS